MGPRILNFAAWRAHSLSVPRQQIDARADPWLQALLTEVAAYPVPPGSASTDFKPIERLATPLRVATRLGPMSFLNTVTVFGTASDITLAELALEMLFPADDQTRQPRSQTSCNWNWLSRPRRPGKSRTESAMRARLREERISMFGGREDAINPLDIFRHEVRLCRTPVTHATRSRQFPRRYGAAAAGPTWMHL
jgi:hypothetical protein